MAFSWQQQIYPAGAQNVNVDIAYLDKTYIYVYLDGVLTTNYTWASDSVIRLDDALAKSTEVLLVRRTTKEYLFILFASGAPFISENLDTQNTQFLHLAQEMVEGRSIEGFYGDISMNGFKITNLGDGTEPGDAVNKGQLDEVDTRVTQLEQTWIVPSSSYPWFTNTTEETDVLVPGYIFTKAAVYINGVCQTPGYSYEVVDNTIMLADPVPAGTHIMARLGEDVPNEQGYATTAQLSAVDTNLRAYADEGDAGVLDRLFDLGFIGTTLPFVENFNWQTAVLSNGQRMNLRIATMINTPAGLDIAGTDSGSAILECIGVNGLVADLVLTASSVNNLYFKVYYIRWRLAPGSRTFAVRQLLTTASSVSVAQGGTGATTAPAARANLGLGVLATKNAGVAVANAAAAPTQAEFNALLTSLRNAGIIAT